MRHVIVSRVSVLLTLLLLAAAVLFVQLVTPARDSRRAQAAATPPSGSRLFEAHCASCHTLDDLRAPFADGSAARRLELERFLADHGDASRDDDRAIVEYVSGRLAPPPE